MAPMLASEAELAIHLTLDQEEAKVIAGRAGLPLLETERRLNELADKGLILPIYAEDGRASYQALPLAVGICEFQANRLTEGERAPKSPWAGRDSD